MNRLAESLKIHPGEGRMAALVIAVMLLTSAGFTLGNTSVEALFFARFGVQFLPYIYMVLSVLSFLVTMGFTALLTRVCSEKIYIFLPVAMTGLLIACRLLQTTENRLVYPLFWLAMAVVELLILLVVWGLSSTLCNTRQSKRLFPLFNTGRIFGAVPGGLGASLLVDRIGTENLILVTAGTLLAASGTAGMLVGQRIRQGVRPRGVRKSQKSIFSKMKKGYQFVRGSDLIRLASLAAAMLAILNFSVALRSRRQPPCNLRTKWNLPGSWGFLTRSVLGQPSWPRSSWRTGCSRASALCSGTG